MRAPAMNGFDTAAVLIAVAAVCGYFNHKVLHLPATSGTLAVALFSSLSIVGANLLFPSLHLHDVVARFVGDIDFDEALMHGMLAFLLFAGALHVDLEGLLEHRWTIGLLATVGVLVSTVVIGVLMWAAFAALGRPLPLLVCLIFGALISPTDPIAVMGLLKDLAAPASLEAQIAGESLFNDGVGVVVFFGLVSVAGFGAVPAPIGATGLGAFFVREVAGGAILGLGLGWLAYHALKRLNEHSLELLITLALAMFTYAASFWVHVSGPIAVVVAGLLIGNPGRQFAMSERTREHVDAFWSMIDEILNALLFLLLGLEVFALAVGPMTLWLAVLTVPIALVGRLVSVAIPVSAMRLRGPLPRGLIPMLTWSGLRGGISVAMALSLPSMPGRELLLPCTYAAVIFSTLVQGLTIRRVLVHYGIGTARV
jgi:CPA1 family monovalent cation:H+ antiporter